jgi:hypothetical protein
MGAEPGPEYILAEFISGGNAPKSMVSVPNRPGLRRRVRRKSSASVYTIGCGRPLLLATVPALQQRTSQLSFQRDLIYPDLLSQLLFDRRMWGT